MPDPEIDLLSIASGTVTAPAGCGKTYLIAETLTRHHGEKPILVLTHTNAGVAALRKRLDDRGVTPRAYKLSTIDGWAIRLISQFPKRSEHDSSILSLANPKNDYPKIRDAAWKLLKSEHISDVLKASYDRLIVDEYQDCSIPQHAIVYFAAKILPTCVLGDDMQSIFGWQGNELADWNKHVCTHFPVAGELGTPWRWNNAGKQKFGEWLLEVRKKLIAGEAIDLQKAPPEVVWVKLDGTAQDRERQLEAARVKPDNESECVLIIGNSKSPPSQQELARQIPGAVTVENVDLKDFLKFAKEFKPAEAGALEALVSFAADVMINVGAADMIKRVSSLQRGTARKDPSEAEQAALDFAAKPSISTAVDLLVEIGKQPGVRAHRPAVMRACMKAMNTCDGNDENAFYNAAVRVREQNRLIGRPLHKRSVGSTLLLKGLEGEIAVIVDVSFLDNAKHLYVAMTRGSKKLIICSKSPVIKLPLA